MDLLPFDDYVQSLPKKRMAAGVLLRSTDGRVLLVEPSYKPNWEIPGGSVDAEEAPWGTAARELREELGLERSIDTVLVVDHEAPAGGYPEGIAWVFDGGLIDDDEVSAIELTDPEIISVGLYRLDEVAGKLSPALTRRISVALDVAQTAGRVALCHDGDRKRS